MCCSSRRERCPPGSHRNSQRGRYHHHHHLETGRARQESQGVFLVVIRVVLRRVGIDYKTSTTEDADSDRVTQCRGEETLGKVGQYMNATSGQADQTSDLEMIKENHLGQIERRRSSEKTCISK